MILSNIFTTAFFSRLLGRKQDHPRKKVLILEGGGMRGIFLAGVLQAFTDRHYFPWKLIIGSSAGALTGTAYAAGQVHIARDALFSKLLTGKFIHLENILRPERHILDLDWMVDTIINGDEGLDMRKLRGACPVLITATLCEEHRESRTVYLNSKKDDVLIALKATAALPFFYRGFVNYRDMPLLDGGMLDPIPYKKALELGYREKDILVVTTRNRGYRKKMESFWVRYVYEHHYKNPAFRFLVQSLENRYLMYNRLLDELEYRHTGIEVIYPPAGFKVERLTQDGKKILAGFEMGVEAAKEFLKAGK